MRAAANGRAETWRGANEALRDAVVEHAVRRVPFYRGVAGPGTAFRDLPVMTKETIRREGERLLADGVPRERRLLLRTSGSSGEPLAIYRDSAQGPMEHGSARRFLERLQRLPEDVTTVWVAARARSIPAPPPRGLRRWRPGGRPPPRVMAVPTHTLVPGVVPRLVRSWSRLPGFLLYGYASALDWIAAEIEGRGLGPIRPAAVVTTGDTLTSPAAERLLRVFDAPLHSWYGSNEVNGFVAGTLPGTRRYAFNPLLVHLEILDDEDRPVAPGHTGRIVVTDCNNYVAPLIRYDTQDVAVASAETMGGFPLVDDIVGRSSEVIRLPSGRILSPLTLGMRLFIAEDFVPHIRAYQCAEVAPNRLELRVAWAGADPGSAVRDAMARSVRQVLDPDTDLEIRTVEEIDRLPSGKGWILRREY